MELEIAFQQILNLNELIVTSVTMSETRIDIECCSAFEEAICPSCLKKQKSVNQTYTREVRDLAISEKKVFLHITERQFYCSDCDRYFMERFSFVDKNEHFTERYQKRIFQQIKQCSISQVIVIEDICWKTANAIFERQSDKQLIGNENFRQVKFIGLDEFSLKKGHKDFATVVVDLERYSVITVLPYREKDKLVKYFQSKGKDWCSGVELFCSDMWDGFVNMAKEVFPKAEITIDRFHFFKQVNQAVDNQRKSLRKDFKEEEDLKNIKYLLLRNYDTLTKEQQNKLERAFQVAPVLKDIHSAKENLRKIFEQDIDKQQATQKIDEWTENAKKLNNKYLNKFINTLNNWKAYILNYFCTRLTTSIIEGMNNKIKMIKRMGFGFTNFANFRLRILAAFN